LNRWQPVVNYQPLKLVANSFQFVIFALSILII